MYEAVIRIQDAIRNLIGFCLELGFGFTAAAVNWLIAIPTAFTWYWTPQDQHWTVGGMLFGFSYLFAWLLSCVDLLRPRTYRHWHRVLCVPVGAFVNAYSLFPHCLFENEILARLGRH